MIFFAHLDENNIVTNVTTASIEMDGKEDDMSASRSVTLKQTWQEGGPRKNFAGVGYKYDPVLDVFIPPRPFSSWAFNLMTYTWEAPIPKPLVGEHLWDDQTGVWVAM
jgi:hypothetical protein